MMGSLWTEGSISYGYQLIEFLLKARWYRLSTAPFILALMNFWWQRIVRGSVFEHLVAFLSLFIKQNTQKPKKTGTHADIHFSRELTIIRIRQLAYIES